MQQAEPLRTSKPQNCCCKIRPCVPAVCTQKIRILVYFKKFLNQIGSLISLVQIIEILAISMFIVLLG
uniref:Uncharacterized protein n=1 Tax=Setaria italica TaxID=4555 RepID=K3YFT1_SETIT